MSIRSSPLLLVCLLVTGVAQAQYRNYSLRCLAPIIENIDPNAPDTLQEAFLAGPYHFAEPLEDVGADSIEFPISTDSEEARRMFEQGVALLHVLWYEEAERAFRTVVEFDPDCPMGYWGLAHANERTPQRARIFAEAARDRCDRNRPEIEQRWTALLADFYSQAEEESTGRSLSRVRALEELSLDFPDHKEARAFLIRRLTLDQFLFGLPVTSSLSVDSLADDFAKKFPEHPSRHYRVFLWMNRRPARLLDEALAMTDLAPGAPEIWRYSAEAHAAAARSVDAVSLAEIALRVDHQFLAERNQMPWQSRNLGNNHEALVDLLIGAGRIEEAVASTKRVLQFPRQLIDGETGAEHMWMKARFSAGQWETFLGELEKDPILSASNRAVAEATRLSWKGIAQLAIGQIEGATATIENLQDLERNAIIEGITSFEEASIADSRSQLATVHRLFTESSGESPGTSRDPLDFPPVVQARLLELSGRTGEAYQVLEEEITNRPYQWLPTAVFCRLADTSGHGREALYPIDRQFRSDASLADTDLLEFEALDSLAARLRLPEDWKFPAPETGLEVPPETLGPESWSPPPAPGFDLEDRRGKSWKLARFSGRPVLIQFFLGVQCAFCLEQFDTFRPHLPSFADAGIDMLAISIDSQENLQKFLGTEETVDEAHRDRFPFPVLSDSDLATFRRYGVFDEFENGPMHATVLVAPDGKILWRNIAHTPFNAPEELLDEAERLLSVRSLAPLESNPGDRGAESTTAP